MVATIPPVIVAKPTPSLPLRYGLFQAAIGPLDLPVHARNGGLEYITSVCGEGFGYEIECIAAQNSKAADFELGSTTVLGVPFIVYATLTCPPVGFTFAEQRDLVMDRLRSVEQAVVEDVLSTGTFGQAPSLLTTDGIVTVTGAGDTVVDVLSELERAMYCGFSTTTQSYGQPAYLHVAIPVLNALKAQHIVEFDGLRWRTPMGTVVSAGCYANNTPAGAAPADGVFWMYITGQTVVWRTSDSDVMNFIADPGGSLDRATNQMLMLAEREYVVTFECGGFAKPVTLWT